ncbi:hypothetical protein HPB52_004057 [Rhipicephalus sanguineus]|uniref:Netrin axonal chemotropic factor n=1 Tax=Rhipicephalus sanguineus TaxID=34632 RepID=A0A9D4T4X4_RHISA|nr:hypothetical protein HPB52_004057 [Rhipicephalus sanguineus]
MWCWDNISLLTLLNSTHGVTESDEDDWDNVQQQRVVEDTVDLAPPSVQRHVGGTGGGTRHRSEVEVQKVFEERKPGSRNFTAHRYRQTPEESEEEDTDQSRTNYTRRVYSVSASGTRGHLSRTDSGSRHRTEEDRTGGRRGSAHFDEWSRRTSTDKPPEADGSRPTYIRRTESTTRHRWSSRSGGEDDASLLSQSRRYGSAESSSGRHRWSATTEQPIQETTSVYEGRRLSVDRATSQHRWSGQYSTDRPDRPTYTQHRSSLDRPSSRRTWSSHSATERTSWSASEISSTTTDTPEVDKSGSTYVRQQYHSITAGRHHVTSDLPETSSEGPRRGHWGAGGQHHVEAAGHGRESDHDGSRRWSSHRVTSAEDTASRGLEERRWSWRGSTARFGEHGNTTRRVDVGSRTRFQPTVIGPPSRTEYDGTSVHQRHRVTAWRNTTIVRGEPTHWSEDTQRRYGGHDDVRRGHGEDTTYTRTSYTRRINGTAYYGGGQDSSRWTYGRDNITSGSSVTYGSSRASGTYGGTEGQTEPPIGKKRKGSWWQSENGVQSVSIRLDLEAEFHFTHLIITFKTFRPAAMLIERSHDNGHTWKVYQYFAYDCNEAYPHVRYGPRRNITDVTCESHYSGVEPSTNGEVIFRVLPPHIHIDNPHSPDVQDLLKMTNLRINFTKLHTLGDNLLDSRREIKQKYYYAVYDMVVRGSCSCYGHASRCIPEEGESYAARDDMVFGKCQCTHNTKGLNCESCEDLYNDQPWRPASERDPNPCKPCNCNGHASKCHFDAAVWERSGRVSGGVCDDCQDNTMGLNCEQCVPFYFKDPQRDISDPYVCQPCDCDPRGSLDEGVCDPQDDPTAGLVAGRCHCKKNVESRRCDRCKKGFFNFQAANPDGCEPCSCHELGTAGDGCNVYTGECTCKRNVIGRDCNQCLPEYYGLSHDDDGCKPCDCDPGGAYENSCDVISGQCRCRPSVQGRRCDQPDTGFFVGNLDFMVHEAELAKGSPDCQVLIREAYADREASWTGLGFMQVHQDSYLEFDVPDIPTSMDYNIVFRYEPKLPQGWEEAIVTVDRPGPVDPNGPCANAIPQDDRQVISGFAAGSAQDSCDVDVDGAEELMPVALRDTLRGVRFADYVEADTGASVCGALTDEDIIAQVAGAQPVAEEPEGEEDEDDEVPVRPSASAVMEALNVARLFFSFEEGEEDSLRRVRALEQRAAAVAFREKKQMKGRRYKVRVTFKQYDREVDTPSASILIDSMVLMPDINAIPFFHGTPANEYRREEFERFRCGQAFYAVRRGGTLPEVCKKYLYSIGFYVFQGAQDCRCDPQGSHSSVCNTLGGQCQCKTNVVGRSCDRCAPGTYGFGPGGCRPCDCNGIGSLDNFCDAQTGQCKCRPNTYGRQCDECQPGYWNYPNCQRCDCNGHADTCDSRTGHCIQCRDFTSGPHCDRCEVGFYGDPRYGVDIPCRPCPCPGTADSGINHATSCDLDPRTGNVICHCAQGYVGKFAICERCDRCANNYYGEPNVPGGSCRRCECSGNVDETQPGNCDSRTGVCLRCLYNTEGPHCERCKPGHFGNASQQQCYECVCNLLGLDPNQGYCDPVTGQCPCLPNVEGIACDRCAPNYWKIASGEGCEACGCDPLGSYDLKCNEFDGQCPCKPGHGGRQCNQCQDNHWGDPRVRCYQCECNVPGAATSQCHRNNGSCVCIPGVAGDRCQQCARGFTGRAPHCDSCGECFDNWDRIIQELREETQNMINSARQIKQQGTTGVYTREFQEMEEKLREVEEILNGANITGLDLLDRQSLIEEIRRNLTESQMQLEEIGDRSGNVTQRSFATNLMLASLHEQAQDLGRKAKELRENTTALQEANVEGALNITREAQRRSQLADGRVRGAQEDIGKSQAARRYLERKLQDTASAYNRTYQENENALRKLQQEVADLEDQISDVNELVCYRRGTVDRCDALCGGAGCNHCGGLGCEEGALTRANNTLTMAVDANQILGKKEAEARDLFNSVGSAEKESQRALEEAKKAFERSQLAKNQSEEVGTDLQDLLDRIDKFLSEVGARPAEIRVLAEECIGLSISLKPEQIRELAKEINDTIASLTDIDAILRETGDDLRLAKDLKAQADRARTMANKILDTAKEVLQNLDDAAEAQGRAKEAIDQARQHINTAEEDLAQIEDAAYKAQGVANRSLDQVGGLQDRLAELKKQYTQNNLDARKAVNEAKGADRLAGQAHTEAEELEAEYNRAVLDLGNKSSASGDMKDRAEKLRERARKLAEGVNTKAQQLQGMEDEFDENEQRLKDYSGILEQLNQEMMGHLQRIDQRSTYYRECQN